MFDDSRRRGVAATVSHLTTREKSREPIFRSGGVCGGSSFWWDMHKNGNRKRKENRKFRQRQQQKNTILKKTMFKLYNKYGLEIGVGFLLRLWVYLRRRIYVYISICCARVLCFIYVELDVLLFGWIRERLVKDVWR